MKKMSKNDILMCTTAVFGVTAVTFAILFGWKSCNSSPKAELFMNMIYHYKEKQGTSGDFKKVAINYNGSIAKIDWGDGVIEEREKITPLTLTHTYSNIDPNKDYLIAIYGTPIGVTLTNKDEQKYIEVGNYGIKEIKLFTQITSVYAYQFAYCDGLEIINIPSTVSRIRENAFKSCTSLKEVHVTTSFAHKLETIEQHAFDNCSSLKYFAIPENVTSIEPYTFNNCVELERFTFPRYTKLKSIKEHAFDNCKKLFNLYDFPTSTLETIESYAFSNCSALADDLYIPTSVTTTGERIFANAGADNFKLHVPFKENEKPANWSTNWNLELNPTKIVYKQSL